MFPLIVVLEAPVLVPGMGADVNHSWALDLIPVAIVFPLPPLLSHLRPASIHKLLVG